MSKERNMVVTFDKMQRKRYIRGTFNLNILLYYLFFKVSDSFV